MDHLYSYLCNANTAPYLGINFVLQLNTGLYRYIQDSNAYTVNGRHWTTFSTANV